MSKGSWTRVKNRVKYDRRKERIYMHVRDVILNLSHRIDTWGREPEVPFALSRDAAVLAVDWGNEPADIDKDTMRSYKSRAMVLHDKLDELEGI